MTLRITHSEMKTKVRFYVGRKKTKAIRIITHGEMEEKVGRTKKHKRKRKNKVRFSVDRKWSFLLAVAERERRRSHVVEGGCELCNPYSYLSHLLLQVDDSNLPIPEKGENHRCLISLYSYFSICQYCIRNLVRIDY